MLIIFDWDGTIVDSLGKIQRCMQAAMHDAGLAILPESEIRQIVGLGMQEATDVLYPDAPFEKKKALQSAYRVHFVAAEEEGLCTFFDGALETVKWLRSLGHNTAIATGKSRAGLDRVLRANGQGQLFDGSRCADETASKPNPLMLKQLLAQFSLLPAQAVMIGDTDYDLEMANAAGVSSVGVSFGAHSISRLKKAQPLHIGDSYADLQAWLERHLAGSDKISAT